MEAIKTVLDHKIIREAITNSNHEPSSGNCWRCWGTGTRFRDAQTGKIVRHVAGYVGQVFAEDCLCARRRTSRAQLKQVPPVFGSPKLSRLKAREDLHPRQAAAIEFVQDHANDSFLLLGRNQVGKSHIAWALFRYATSQKRSAVACTVRDLLAEYRRLEIGAPDGETLKSPRVTAENLRKPGKPWLLFLDEFEKARPTEFASEMLFNLLDAAKSFNHQIVITSNMKPEELRAHWGRIDEIWGNSIMARLWDCHRIELF